MKRVVVTGGMGFIGRNLLTALGRRGDVDTRAFDVDDPPEALRAALVQVDTVFHLAGVNRPQDPAEFQVGNVDFTRRLCEYLHESGARPTVVFASSIQAELDNPYGASKAAAEGVLAAWSRSGADRGHIPATMCLASGVDRTTTQWFPHSVTTSHGLPASR